MKNAELAGREDSLDGMVQGPSPGPGPVQVEDRRRRKSTTISGQEQLAEMPSRGPWRYGTPFREF